MNREELLFIVKVRDEANRVLKQTGAEFKAMGRAAEDAGKKAYLTNDKASRSLRDLMSDAIKTRAAFLTLGPVGSRVGFDIAGAAIQARGALLGLALGVGAVSAALVTGIPAAMRFNSQMNQMSTLAGQSKEQIAEWKQEVLGMVGEVGKGPMELAEAMYFASSSGIEASRVVDTVRKSAMAAAAGLGTTAVVTDAATSAMNAYRASAWSPLSD